MAGALKFYIFNSQKVIKECGGCTFIIKLRLGLDADKLICCRHPVPEIQFLFEKCSDFSLKRNEN